MSQIHSWSRQIDDLLVWSQCGSSCEGLLSHVLSTLSPPGGFLESPRRRCHVAARRWTHQGCFPNHSRLPRTAGCEEEGSPLCTHSNMMNYHITYIKYVFYLPAVSTIKLTHIPRANENRDDVRFTQLRVSSFHQLEELAESVPFLKNNAVTPWIMGEEIRSEIAVNHKTSNLVLPVCSQTSSPMACCGGCRPPCEPWLDSSGTWQSEGLKSRADS